MKSKGKDKPAKGRSRLWKVTKWVVGLLLLGAVIFFYGYVPWFLAGIASTRQFHYHDPLDGRQATRKRFGHAYPRAVILWVTSHRSSTHATAPIGPRT